MEENCLFINQKAVEENLYSRLQQQTLEEIQRLSGEVWTNFNIHDPGITTADIANYLLSEFDYKLGFPLHDYLTEENSTLQPEQYGLFLPEKVYPTTPVTEDDYRKLLLSEFPELSKLDLSCDVKTGAYKIRIELSPFAKNNPNLTGNIRKCFHAHRNLCEKLDSVTVYTPPLLHFHSEFEIHPGEDATSVLANVYWNIMQYLSGSIKVEGTQDCIFSNLSPEEWFDGVTTDSRVVIPEQKNTETELYRLLIRLKGIKSFKTCYIISNENGEEVIKTDFRKGYSLYIPKYQSEFNVKIRIDNSLMPIGVERFSEELQALYFSKNSFRSENRNKKPDDMLLSRNTLPEGTYRPVFGHHPMAADFPKCYQISTEKQFGAYLELYDLIIQRGLSELDGLKSLCSIEQQGISHTKMKIAGSGYRNITAIKTTYLDFLDHLYGVDSNPAWMAELSFYGETENDRMERRIEFLRNVHWLTKTRSRARNMDEGQNEENVATIKAWLSYLLNMNMNEAISAGNILPGHNLILLGDNPENKPMRDKLNSMLINERMMDVANIEMVTPDESPADEDRQTKYRELRHNMPVFNSNFISGGLFRWGINLDNYKLVKQVNGEYLLAFWNPEDNSWMNLARSDKDKLNEWANTLSRYLTGLNRQCEVMYVVEHNLLFAASPFTVSFVFSGWTTRFRSERFRKICCQLIKSLLPAHIEERIYWLDVSEMQHFEDSYRTWCKALQEDCPKIELEDIQKKMMGVLATSTAKS